MTCQWPLKYLIRSYLRCICCLELSDSVSNGSYNISNVQGWSNTLLSVLQEAVSIEMIYNVLADYGFKFCSWHCGDWQFYTVTSMRAHGHSWKSHTLDIFRRLRKGFLSKQRLNIFVKIGDNSTIIFLKKTDGSFIEAIAFLVSKLWEILKLSKLK